MIRRRLLGLAVGVAVVGAACTTEQSSNPGPTLTSTTSTIAASHLAAHHYRYDGRDHACDLRDPT